MLRLAILVLAMAVVIQDASANGRRPKGPPVEITGCISRGVEGCISISPFLGRGYDVSSINPLPARREITLNGTIKTGAVGRCMGPPVLENISWRYTGGSCSPFP